MTPGEPPGEDGPVWAGGESYAAVSGGAPDDAPGDQGDPDLPGGPGVPGGMGGPAGPGGDADGTDDTDAADTAQERWLDEQAGPLVRPYVMTRGRTEPIRGTFDLITMVAATGSPAAPELGLDPEHHAVIGLCARPMSVAELAGHLKLPTVTVRVLLGDLLDKDLISVEEPQTETELADDDDMYQAVIDGLHAL